MKKVYLTESFVLAEYQNAQETVSGLRVVDDQCNTTAVTSVISLA